MIILHCAETLTGGIASYLNEIIPYQQKLWGKDAVHVLGPEAQKNELMALPPACWHGFQREKRGPQALYHFARRYLEIAKKIEPDIVHLHSSFAGGIGRALSLWLPVKTKVIYCAHGWSFGMQVEAWKKFIYTMIEKLLAAFADRIVTISEYETCLALKAGLPFNKIVTVISGITPLMEPLAKTPVDGRRKAYLFVGRNCPQKGLDILLEAVGRLRDPNFDLLVIGTTPIAHVPPNVQFLGWQKRSELAAFYHAADALIMPSRWEGFGLAAIEAMSCGTPVIASNRGALPDIIRNKETGLLFSLEDTDALARLLNETTRKKLAQMGETAASDMRIRFTSERMNRELTAVYTNIIPSP